MYSVNELCNKFRDKVIELGTIDEKFKDNPAFDEVMSKLREEILNMNIENYDDVMVACSNGVISFTYNSNSSENFKVSISCPNAKTIVFLKLKEDKFISTKVSNRKSAVEYTAKLSRGGILFTKLVSVINDMGCKEGICKNFTSSEWAYYTGDGIMHKKEITEYKQRILTGSVAYADVNSMLFLPRRQLFDPRSEIKQMTRITRQYLDTAELYIFDNGEIIYRGIVPLIQEKGLANMYCVPYLQGYTIESLTADEIKEMIERKTNERVKEGLRGLAIGRENYSYDSNIDPEFVCWGDNSKKKK